MDGRDDFRDGVRAIAPLLPAVAAVAAAAGIAGPVAGLSRLQTVAMSVVVYFPSVMLAALDLVDAGVPVAVVVLTSLVVGVRVVVLSLSIGPLFGRFSTRWKWFLAYFLLTPVYALTVERVSADPETDVRAFYLGMAAPLWLTMQLFVAAGAAFGTSIPAGLHLEFVVPLAFIALVARLVTDRGTLASALCGAVLAVLASGVPSGLGVLVATAGGTLAGALVHRWGGGG
jgi:predicted branched-subunit amino acid permease